MEGLYNSIKTREQLQNEIDLLPAAGQMTFNYGPPLPVDLVLPLRNASIPLYKATGSIVFEDGFTSVDGDEFEAIVDPGAVGTVQTTIYNPVPTLPSADVTPLTYYYYDHYSWGGNKPYQAGDISKPQQGDNIHKDDIVKTSAVSGYLTGTGVRVLGTNQWLYTTNYYDEKGRIIQAVSDNAAGGVETVTNLYDFNNKLISSYQRHTKPGNAATPETRVLNIYNYDHAGRLMTSIMKLNDDNALERILASNTYYETGELKTKNLGGLRDMTYDYSIGGQLKSINKDYIYGAGTGSFGEELFYDYGYTENQFTGEIAGVIWRGDGPARSYGYEYDPTGRLTKADFTQKDGGSNWLQTTMNYSVLGPVSNNGRIKYNLNGNLLEIVRKGMKGGVSTDIDVLSYRYYTNSNQLLYVTDASNDPNSTLGDFKETTTGQPVDYIYDENGNLKIDENKGITSIVYNELDLPISISVAGKGMIYYKYDAAGTKIEKRVIDSTGTAPVERKFDYIGGLVYEDNVLKYISHSEGRIRVIQKPALPIAYYYDYFIKDHLGNVRIVYSEQTDISTYNASMEPPSAELENRLFRNIEASRVVRPSGYPALDSSNQHVARLNAKYPDKRIGPSLVLKVMCGDTVSVKVNAFFKSEEPVRKRTPDPAVDMLSPLLQAFGRIESGGAKIGGARVSTPFNQSFTSGSYQRLKEDRSDNGLSDKPKAYLNYILFDEQMNLVEENSGVKQIQSAPDELQYLVKNKMPVTRNGYLYVYTSNESQQDVYFDDLTVVMSTGGVNEETHYYPFGLTMKEISSKAITAPTYPENNIKYNGKELQAREFMDGSGLEWYDYGARMYDPQVARWHVVDAKNGNYPNLSPYLYCGNNPVANVDVDGNTHYPALNVLKVTMQGWGQRAEFRQWQLSTPAGLSYMLSRQREDAMRKDVMTGIAPYISDKTSGNSVAKAMAEKGVGTKLFLGMSEMMIGMTPVLGSTVRALAATKYGDKKGAVLNATFAFIEGAAIFGGLSTVSNMGGGAGAYDGVRAASNYLQAQGVPRAYRKQILESFEVGTISLRTADNATFGLRFYGGAANQSGRYLFPTFTNYTNRAGLALPPSWNSMSGISQFQIAPGSTYIFGRAASQGGIYGGGSYQMYINNLNNLIK
ncbi:RHS repeat-associated core domain-containing protein [Chitinophaga sp. XS-30]|nr:RHS repeat-associated core domain-containing protein [Chitinophaga sp. XS-30]